MAKPTVLDLDAIFKIAPLEERIYRHRCVEALVDGDSLDRISAERAAEAGGADREGQVRRVRELLRFQDHAELRCTPASGFRTWKACEWMRPCIRLTLLAVGLYGETLPNQDGAPFRLVVPWKYGFKSIKSIVKIRLVEKEPPTTWNLSAPNEYGFYSNVNPGSGPSALEPGQGTPDRRIPHARYREVQRLRRSGGESLHRNGSSQELLRA